MSRNHAAKNAARRRQAETGESYQAALQATRTEPAVVSYGPWWNFDRPAGTQLPVRAGLVEDLLTLRKDPSCYDLEALERDYRAAVNAKLDTGFWLSADDDQIYGPPVDDEVWDETNDMIDAVVRDVDRQEQQYRRSTSTKHCPLSIQRGWTSPCTGEDVLATREVYSAFGLEAPPVRGCVDCIGLDAAGWDHGGEFEVVIRATQRWTGTDADLVPVRDAWRTFRSTRRLREQEEREARPDLNPMCGHHVDDHCPRCGTCACSPPTRCGTTT